MKLVNAYIIAVACFAQSQGSVGALAHAAHSLDTHTNTEGHARGYNQRDGAIRAAKDNVQHRVAGRELKGRGRMMGALKMNAMNGGMNMKGSAGVKGSSKTARPTRKPTAHPTATLKPTSRPTTVRPSTAPSESPSSTPSSAPVFK